LRTNEIRIKEKDEDFYVCKKDIDGSIGTNQNLRADLNDGMIEKDALERHSRVLLG